MIEIAIIGGMTGLAFGAMALLAWLVRKGASGLALTIMSVLGAVLVILFYATGGPIGVDPLVATVLVLVGALPAFLGGSAGALLGWMLRRRDDRQI